MQNVKKRGLGLFSGGLDSMLAAAVLRDQGIEVAGVCFVTPFYGAARARQSAAHLGLPLQVVDFTAKFSPLIYAPPHGFGKGHNPCIDCHILMLREAGALMAAQGFDFIFTGEVLGQRPMSQHRGSLNLVARESGYAELVLRPLSARLLKPTLPEREGWVDRERLLNLNGRGRRAQMALAEKYGITDYPVPAGGCLLTDPRYVARLKEFLAHQERLSPRDAELLKLGRHFRLPGGSKAVVGRIEKENDALLSLQAPDELLFKVQGFPGPLVLISGDASEDDLKMAAALAAAYSDAPAGVQVTVAAEGSATLNLSTPSKDEFKGWLI